MIFIIYWVCVYGDKIKDGNSWIGKSKLRFTLFWKYSPYISLSVGYHIKSIYNNMYHLIYNHISHSSKNCSFQILIIAICSLNYIEINVECEINIFGNIFLIRMERGVCSVCCCLYRHIKIHSGIYEKNCPETRNVAIALNFHLKFIFGFFSTMAGYVNVSL